MITNITLLLITFVQFLLSLSFLFSFYFSYLQQTPLLRLSPRQRSPTLQAGHSESQSSNIIHLRKSELWVCPFCHGAT